MAISGTAAWIMAGAAVAGTGYSIYAGEEAAKRGRIGLRRQEAAQSEAKQSALAQQIKADQTAAAANRKQPDVSSLLAFEQQPNALSSSMAPGGGRKGGRARPALLGDA